MITPACESCRLLREFNEITGMEHLIQCVTYRRPIINISSFAPLLLTLFSHISPPHSPNLEPAIGRAENVEGGTLSLSPHMILTVFPQFHGRTTPQQDQGEGAKGEAADDPALLCQASVFSLY